MSRLRALIAPLVALALAVPSAAGAVATPQAGWVPDGGVSDVLALPGGRLLVAGGFTRWAPRTGSAVVLGRDDGRLVPAALPEVAGGEVTAALPDGHGGVYLGGTFRYVGGKPRNGLAHVGADGRVDGFRADAAYVEGPFRYGPLVAALLLDGDRLLVGGGFTEVGGASRSNVAAVDARTGRVLPWAPPAQGTVRALAAAGDVVFVGGDLWEVGGEARAGLAAVARTSGALLPWEARVDGSVEALAVDGRRLLVAGGFAKVADEARHGLAAVDVASGALDAWAPAGGDSGRALLLDGDRVLAAFESRPRGGAIVALDPATGAERWRTPVSGSVRTLARDGGRLLVAGRYSRLGGKQRGGIGVLDAATGALRPWRARPLVGGEGAAAALPVRRGILVAGGFVGVGGVARRGLAVLDRRSLRPTARVIGGVAWANALVRAFGRIYVAGRRGARDRAGFALDARTLRPVAWTPPRLRVGAAYAIAQVGRRIVVTGSWNGIGPSLHHGSIAALDPETGALLDRWGEPALNASGLGPIVAFGGRLYTYGSVRGEADTVAELDPATGRFRRYPLDNVDSGLIAALAFGPRGETYVGGAVIRIGRSRVRNIARVDLASGRVLTRFRASVGDTVSALLALPRGGVVVGGQFRTVDGRHRTGLAVLDARGRLSAWTADLDGHVSRLRRLGRDLVVLGEFRGAGPRAQAYMAVYPGVLGRLPAG